jgi:hypothetical protein
MKRNQGKSKKKRNEVKRDPRSEKEVEHQKNSNGTKRYE